MRKSALFGASWTRDARVFVGQSSETPGAFELGMRRSSGGLRDGVARVDVSIHRVDAGMWRVLPCAAHELVGCGVPEKLCYPDQRAPCTSGDRYGRVLSFTAIIFNYTVTGATI